MYGLGKGMAYVMPLSCGMKWYSDRKGLAAGIVLTAYGLGAFAFNSLITFYINPNNAKPAAGTRYFTDPAVIERIPKVFPVLGVVYAIILVVGSLMMCHPPKQEQVALDDPSSKENTQKGDEPMRESHLDDITDPKSSRERVASLGGGSVEKIAGEDGEKVDIVTGDSSLSPRQTVQAYEFYLLFFTFFFNQQGIGYMATMSKDFGLSFIKDDKFLGIVAAVSAVASSLCRSIWGGLSDKVGYRLAMFIVTGLLVIELVIFAFTPEMGMYAYGVMMVVIYFTFPGTQALLPSCTAQTFGPTFTSSNYGMIYWAPAFGQGLSAVISAFIAPLLGDKGTIFLIAALVSVTIALTFFYHKKPSPELIRERKGWPATDD
jgi:MFS family permease